MKKLFIILSACVLAAACNDIVTYDTDLPDRFSNSGAPVIEAVYDIHDADLETPLTEGALAQIIHIVGKNLANPTSVSFNGIETDLDKCYCENEHSYILIPRVMPSAVSNTLEYKTLKGSVSIDFEISVPELRLDGLANEFASAGSTVRVAGDYFDLYGFGAEGSDASITIGTNPVEIASADENGLYIVIPEGTPDRTLITFSWNDLKLGPQTKKIPFRNTSYLFFKNFATTGFWDADLAASVVTDGTAEGDPESPGYKFWRFKNSYASWTWNSLGMGDGWYYDTPEDWATNWVFKFELWTNPAKPVPAYNAAANQGLFVQLNLKANVPLDLGGGAINTGGEWRTFSFPLSKVASEMPSSGDYWGFAFTIQPPTDWDVDFAIANIRIEPENY